MIEQCFVRNFSNVTYHEYFCNFVCRSTWLQRAMDGLGVSRVCSFCRYPNGHYRGEHRAVCPGALAERTGWICQLCREPIDPWLPRMMPGAPSIDHIVPRAEGGGNEISNLRLAHRGCNGARSTLDDASWFDLLGLDATEEEEDDEVP